MRILALSGTLLDSGTAIGLLRRPYWTLPQDVVGFLWVTGATIEINWNFRTFWNTEARDCCRGRSGAGFIVTMGGRAVNRTELNGGLSNGSTGTIAVEDNRSRGNQQINIRSLKNRWSAEDGTRSQAIKQWWGGQGGRAYKLIRRRVHKCWY